MMNITEFKCTCHFFCYNPWINAALLSLVAAFYSIATFMDDFLLFVVFTQESGILLGNTAIQIINSNHSKQSLDFFQDFVGHKPLRFHGNPTDTIC